MPEKESRGSGEGSRDKDLQFFKGLARAFGGAIIFALPLFMTMEMWWIGFYLDRFRLSLLMVLMIPLLIGISRYSGFKETSSWTEDAVDAMVAYGVAFIAAVVVLALMNVINLSMQPREIIGKIAVQAIPGSFGAILATSQLGGNSKEKKKQEQKKKSAGYPMELVLMVAGALFLAFNLAPTEEMILIAFKMTNWHAAVMAVVSIVLMHAFVYAVGFSGQAEIPPGTPWWSVFVRYTVVGYALALIVSAYVLWTLGRFEDSALALYVIMTIVLGFPASIGAAAARLIL